LFDYEAFQKLINKKGVKLNALARFLGISPTTLYRKVTGKSDFTRAEIQKCCEFFGEKEMNCIFFA
jgi:Response regulator containing CheY-like receiver, AAA-type ATPase, and DNA-binding domains